MLELMQKSDMKNFTKKSAPVLSQPAATDQQGNTDHSFKLAATKESRGATLVPWFLKLFGVRLCYLVLPFPVFFYFLFGGPQRRGIVDFYRRLYPGDTFKNVLRAFFNYYYFGMTLIDRLMPVSFWDPQKDFGKHDHKTLFHAGSFFICTHFGDWFCAALALARIDSVKVSLVVDLRQTPKFRDLIKSIGEEYIQFIDSSSPTVEFVLKIKKEIESGGCIAFMGDRCFEGQNSSSQPFLGQPADFPISHFKFATLLRCPIYTFFGVKKGMTSQSKFKIYNEMLYDGLEKVKAETLVNRYVKKLETLILKYPQQWFNFYHFWKKTDRKS
jgi:predicted LPLAT superfamily acyltransferase